MTTGTADFRLCAAAAAAGVCVASAAAVVIIAATDTATAAAAAVRLLLLPPLPSRLLFALCHVHYSHFLLLSVARAEKLARACAPYCSRSSNKVCTLMVL